MDDHSKSQVKRLITQSPEYAAGYKAGREAGMREAVSIIRREQTEMTDPVFWATAILSAIGGGGK